MKSLYRMCISIKDFDPKKKEEIKSAVTEEWPEFEWRTKQQYKLGYAYAVPMLFATGEDYLSGTESENDFADAIALAAWRANNGYCEVIIDQICLEQIGERYFRDENAYEMLRETYSELPELPPPEDS